MRRSTIFAFVVVGVGGVVGACGLEEGGIAPGQGVDGSIGDALSGDGGAPIGDGAPPGDSAISDASDGSITGDAGRDSGSPVTFSCGGTPVDHCATGCPTKPLECPSNGTCVANCGLCNATTLFQCDACYADGGVAVSRCEPQNAAAFAECLTGFNRCPCGNAGNCPGDNQTCESNLCFECAEPDAGNQDHDCKNGTGPHKCHTGAGIQLGTCF